MKKQNNLRMNSFIDNKKIIVVNKGRKIKDIVKEYACCKKTQRTGGPGGFGDGQE